MNCDTLSLSRKRESKLEEQYLSKYNKVSKRFKIKWNHLFKKNYYSLHVIK